MYQHNIEIIQLLGSQVLVLQQIAEYERNLDLASVD